MSGRWRECVGGYGMAWFFGITGLATLWWAWRIPVTGFQNTYDPGPRVVPMLCGGLLLAGGLWEGVRKALGRSEPGGEVVDWKAFGVFLGGLVVYALAMRWVGFAPATVLLGTLMTWALGSRWWVALGLALGLAAAVHGLFVHLFRVPLPEGLLGLPF